MQELRRVEQVIGEEAYDAHGRGESRPSPLLFLALVYGKLLHTPFGHLKVDDIDFDISELAAYAETDEEKAWVSPQATDGPDNAAGDSSVVIPMETTTGTVEAEVDIG